MTVSIYRGAIAAMLLLPAASQAAAPESIGTWVLNCPEDSKSGCILRHRDRYFAKPPLSADLEVQSVRGALVPVLAVRGIPREALLAASLGGRTEASVRLGNGAWVPLDCGAAGESYQCAPAEGAAATLSASLPAAGSATLRLSVGLLPGMAPVQAPERALDLAGTQAALARLRAVGAIAAPRPAEPVPEGWLRLADQALKAIGYKNGIADLPAFLRR